MENKTYLIWKKRSPIELKNDEFNQSLVELFCDNCKLDTLDLTFYTDFSDEYEKRMYYVKQMVLVEEKNLMLNVPWSDEPIPEIQPIYQYVTEQFEDSSKALKYVYQLLSELNGIYIKKPVHLLDVYNGTYIFLELDEYEQPYYSTNMITMTFKLNAYEGSSVLFYDSELERITKLKSKLDITEYLGLRETLIPLK